MPDRTLPARNAAAPICEAVSTTSKLACFDIEIFMPTQSQQWNRSNGFKLLLHPTQLGKSLVVPDLRISYLRDLEFSFESSGTRYGVCGAERPQNVAANSEKEGSR